jgi:hypothetical protein
MRVILAFVAALLSALLCGCAGLSHAHGPEPEERGIGSWGGYGPRLDVVCEFRYYVIQPDLSEHPGVGAVPPSVHVVAQSRDTLRCSISEPWRLLSHPDTNLVYDVPGFVLQVIAPKNYVGKILTAHFDGPLASGDPFKAFAPGKRYRLNVPQDAPGNPEFRLCF